MRPKEAALLYDIRRNKWELWYQSRPVVESVNRALVAEWAVNHGYHVVEGKLNKE